MVKLKSPRNSQEIMFGLKGSETVFGLTSFLLPTLYGPFSSQLVSQNIIYLKKKCLSALGTRKLTRARSNTLLASPSNIIFKGKELPLG